jgi:hypothetical protein
MVYLIALLRTFPNLRRIRVIKHPLPAQPPQERTKKPNQASPTRYASGRGIANSPRSLELSGLALELSAKSPRQTLCYRVSLESSTTHEPMKDVDFERTFTRFFDPITTYMWLSDKPISSSSALPSSLLFERKPRKFKQGEI